MLNQYTKKKKMKEEKGKKEGRGEGEEGRGEGRRGKGKRYPQSHLEFGKKRGGSYLLAS